MMTDRSGRQTWDDSFFLHGGESLMTDRLQVEVVSGLKGVVQPVDETSTNGPQYFIAALEPRLIA